MNFSKPTEANTEAFAVVVSDRIVTFEADGSKFRVVQ